VVAAKAELTYKTKTDIIKTIFLIAILAFKGLGPELPAILASYV
jgi:hypothetical protein